MCIEQVARVSFYEAFDLAPEKICLKERVNDCLLRHEFVADGVSNTFSQTLTMARYHPLRPNGYAPEFNRFARAKQHTNRKPRRAVAVQRSNDNPRDCDKKFFGVRVYGR